jgi:hypothetical protein
VSDCTGNPAESPIGCNHHQPRAAGGKDANEPPDAAASANPCSWASASETRCLLFLAQLASPSRVIIAQPSDCSRRRCSCPQSVWWWRCQCSLSGYEPLHYRIAPHSASFDIPVQRTICSDSRGALQAGERIPGPWCALIPKSHRFPNPTDGPHSTSICTTPHRCEASPADDALPPTLHQLMNLLHQKFHHNSWRTKRQRVQNYKVRVNSEIRTVSEDHPWSATLF